MFAGINFNVRCYKEVLIRRVLSDNIDDQLLIANPYKNVMTADLMEGDCDYLGDTADNSGCKFFNPSDDEDPGEGAIH